ncbi:CG31760 [Drosophila busckii]|uniref:CG31760 n=1 Tax=Drosophila busckii TaxID=30019 RepID=A0A0M4EGS1_DROBS|nr:CG31760 [Drosophila busckii]
MAIEQSLVTIHDIATENLGTLCISTLFRPLQVPLNSERFESSRQKADLAASILQEVGIIRHGGLSDALAKGLLSDEYINGARILALNLTNGALQSYVWWVKSGHDKLGETQRYEEEGLQIGKKPANIYPWFDDESSTPTLRSPKFAPSPPNNYYKGWWTYPYFSCALSKWLVSYSIAIPPVGRHGLRGFISVDIDVTWLRVNQCDAVPYRFATQQQQLRQRQTTRRSPVAVTSSSSNNVDTIKDLQAFHSSHKCHRDSMVCDYRQPSNAEAATISSGKLLSSISSSWSRGSYQCLCKDGYYSLRHPDGFNGTIMEIAWQEHQDNISNYYTNVFKCLPCAPGCETCTGPEPCLANYHWPFRISLLTISIACAIGTFLLAGYLFRHRRVKVFKVASPIFLMITLIGCAIMYLEKTHDSETEDIEKVDDEALQAALRDLVQIPDIEPESKVEKQISFHTEPKHERWLEQLRGRTQPSIEPLMSQKPKKDDKWITKHKKLTEQPAAKHETWAEKLKATTLSKTDKKSIEKKFEFQMCAAQAKLTASELHFKHLRIAAASKPKSFEELCHKPAHMASTQTLTVQAATVATGTELTHVEEAVQAVLQEQLPASQLGNVINIITVPSFQRGLNCQKSNEKDEKSFHLLPIKFPILQRLTEKLAQETESPVITPIATPRSSETFINTAVLIAEAPASLGVVANPMSLLPKTENVSHKWINSGLLIVAPDNPEIDAKPGPPASTVSAPEPETNPLIQTNPEAATNPPAIIEPEPESIPFSGSPTIEPNLEEPKKSTVERSESKGTLTIIGRSTRITTQYQDHCHVDRKDSGINKRAKRKLIVACVLCLVFMVCESVGGILANSLAIATDAAHLLTDLVSFLISLFALHLSSRPATQRLNFGWYRAEVIGAMISVYFIWVLTGVLVWMAIDRLVKDVHYVDAKIMLISSALAILFNLVMAVQLTYGSGNAFYKAGDLRSKLRRRKPEPLQIESANSKQNFEDPHTAVKPAESDLMQTTLPVQFAHGHSHMPQENINMVAIFPFLDTSWCIATKWTRHMGFCITYTSLLMKTWRVSLTYRVKSAHKIKLNDQQLLQWMVPILLVMLIYLGTWTISATPFAEVIYDQQHLKFKQCSYNWWDHSLAIGEVLFLAWGIRVCYNVRNAESLYNEARLISYAIYNIAIVNIAMAAFHVMLFPNAGPDYKYMLGFVRTQLSTTTTIALVFGPKIARVVKGQGDKWDQKAKVRSITASFSLNGVGLVPEESPDLYQENEELKEQVQKLAHQIEFMKTVHMQMNNRHLKPKPGGYFTITSTSFQAPFSKNTVSTAQTQTGKEENSGSVSKHPHSEAETETEKEKRDDSEAALLQQFRRLFAPIVDESLQLYYQMNEQSDDDEADVQHIRIHSTVAKLCEFTSSEEETLVTQLHSPEPVRKRHELPASPTHSSLSSTSSSCLYAMLTPTPERPGGLLLLPLESPMSADSERQTITEQVQLHVPPVECSNNNNNMDEDENSSHNNNNTSCSLSSTLTDSKTLDARTPIVV